MIVRIVYSKSPEAQKSRMFLTADHVLVDLEQDGGGGSVRKEQQRT